MPKVNPAILRWARETAGLDEQEAVEKLSIRDARGVAAVDRLRALEDGSDPPSRALLVRMAKKYRRPLLTFYLTSPPEPTDRGEDFRVLPRGAPPEDEPLLDALIRDVRARQGLIKSALLDEEELEPLPFVGSVTMQTGVQAVIDAMRAVIRLPLEEYRGCHDVDEAFALLRTRTEEAGVFVLLLGNLGSHHTNIDLETFRGFALADESVPFLVINDQDHHAAWSFTLLHELAHLWLGQTGVSGGRPELAVERFCNEVASEFLLPAGELEEFVGVGRLAVTDVAQRIGDFASPRKISHSMVAPIKGGKEREGGPSYYVVRRHRLGTALVEATARLMAVGALTTSKAGTVLGA